MERVCSVEGCGPVPEGKKFKRGMCNKHYQRWHKTEGGWTRPPRQRKSLDPAPLREFAARRGVTLDIDGERVHRDTVDEIACKVFKVHPSFIYGLDWDRANAA
jgi:hypothetical protein